MNGWMDGQAQSNMLPQLFHSFKVGGHKNIWPGTDSNTHSQSIEIMTFNSVHYLYSAKQPILQKIRANTVCYCLHFQKNNNAFKIFSNLLEMKI